MLGICDKIVPGLLIGALQFGHLPTVFVPGGPMPSGLSNSEKSKVRELAAQGLVGRAELLEAEQKAYHTQGTCTFYGTANSNQMLMEAMGLHVPGAAFVQPQRSARGAHARGGAHALQHPQGAPLHAHRPPGRRALHRQRDGGAAGHRRLHQPPDPLGGGGARRRHRDRLGRLRPSCPRGAAAGARLSERQADVNQFQAAGGPGYVIRELLDAGLMHEDVLTVREGGLREYTRMPVRAEPRAPAMAPIGASGDDAVVRPAASPSAPPAA
jgi:phosphogluconate dehydratase